MRVTNLPEIGVGGGGGGRDVHSMGKEISAVVAESLPKYNLSIPDTLHYKLTPNGNNKANAK